MTPLSSNVLSRLCLFDDKAELAAYLAANHHVRLLAHADGKREAPGQERVVLAIYASPEERAKADEAAAVSDQRCIASYRLKTIERTFKKKWPVSPNVTGQPRGEKP